MIAPITVALKPKFEATNLGGVGIVPSIRLKIGSTNILAKLVTPPPSTINSGSKETDKFATAIARLSTTSLTMDDAHFCPCCADSKISSARKCLRFGASFLDLKTMWAFSIIAVPEATLSNPPKSVKLFPRNSRPGIV